MGLLLLQVMFRFTVKLKKWSAFLTIICMIMLLSGGNTYSQDEITRYDNVLNPWVLNPAITGSDYNSVNVYANRQWFGIQGAPRFYGIHISGRMAPFGFYTNKMLLNKTSYKSRGNVGLGAALVCDKNGPFGFTELKINYAYHIDFHKSSLSFGLANDFELYGIKESEMSPMDPNDPGIQGVYRNKILYNAGFGIMFYNEIFEVGTAVNNLFKDKVVLKDDYLGSSEIGRTFLIHGNYRILNSGDIAIESGMMIGTQEFDKLLYNFSGGVTWRDDFNLIMTYKSLNYFVINIGADLGKYSIIYGYSSPIGSLPRYIYGSHEITLGMKLAVD